MSLCTQLFPVENYFGINLQEWDEGSEGLGVLAWQSSDPCPLPSRTAPASSPLKTRATILLHQGGDGCAQGAPGTSAVLLNCPLV